MGGRLAGYLIFAVIAWTAGTAATKNITNEKVVIAGIYIVLSVLMIFYGFKRSVGKCVAKKASGWLGKLNINNQTMFVVILGLLTGLNLCPPFLIAFTEGTQAGTILGSILYFMAFFVGTSVYILPMAVLGLGSRVEALRYVGRLASGVMGIYYLYLGISSLQGHFS
jgi:sulfite exporter TauE/SafE